ncbi:MAG: hypothetical protein Q7U75_08005, partial [Desulfobacterales bacterium]|nr:hypothetical protein [Desulfobacterales bacterium]
MSASMAHPARPERTALSAQLRGWMVSRVLPQVITWTLLAAIAVVMNFNFSQAAWVPDSSPLTNAAWGGLLLGTLLAASRFPGWIAVLYHVFNAFLMLGLWIGKVLPPPDQITSQPPVATLELINIRLFSYLDRFSSWVSTYAAGGNIQDNGLFQLLIGLLVWATLAWLAWAAIRRQRALDGLLPAGLVMGINTYLSDQPVDALWLFLGCAILLSARTAMIEVVRGWERRRVDFPDGLGWSWGGAALTLALIILLAARLSPIFGTPQGWKTLGDVFRDAQKRLEETTTRLFGDVAPAPPHFEDLLLTPEPPAPSAETPEMGIVGPAPGQSSALVMWVKTSDPPPPEPEPG